jgi:hypothetical protein
VRKMLNEDEVKALIVSMFQRLAIGNVSRQMQVLDRIATAAYILTGEEDLLDPGNFSGFFSALDIPHTVEADRLTIAPDWLKAHGFVRTADRWRHPTFSGALP